MELIQSKDNRTVKRIHSLMMKKYRTKYGEYVVEGVRAVTDLLERGQLKALCVKESLLQQPAVQSLIKSDKAAHVRRYLIIDSIFDTLSVTVNGQGIIGIAEKKTYELEDFQAEQGIYVLVDAVQDPGNLGTIIRTAVGVGAKGIFLTKGSVDAYNDKTVRSAVSAMNEIPIYEGLAQEDIMYLLEETDLTSYATTLEDAESYNAVDYTLPALLIVGNEGNGVSSSILEAATHRISIPLYGRIESLNLAVATGICLYKMREGLICNHLEKMNI